MNEFKYQFVNFVLLALLGTGIYWAFNTIDNGIIYDKDTIIAVNTENTNQEEEEIVLFDNTKPTVEITTETDIPVETSIEAETELTADEKVLVGKLEALISDNINMRDGSKGTRVGTVQKFLNIYFETNKTVDNQYGPGTVSDVKKFQSAEGLGADGQAGPNTYRKMVEILEK